MIDPTAVMAAAFMLKKKPAEPVIDDSSLLLRSTGAIQPFFFFVAHMIGPHLIARVMPAKRVTYPLLMAHGAIAFLAEHMTAEFPTLGAAGPQVGALTFLSVAAFFYFSFKKTTGNKTRIWASLAIFVATLGIFKGNDWGIPYDDFSEQAAANFDPFYTKMHLLVHTALTGIFVLASRDVPWAADWPVKKSKLVEVPGSPEHTTLSPGRVRKLDCDGPKRVQFNAYKNSFKQAKVA